MKSVEVMLGDSKLTVEYTDALLQSVAAAYGISSVDDVRDQYIIDFVINQLATIADEQQQENSQCQQSCCCHCVDMDECCQ
jgi:hypothetical protein